MQPTSASESSPTDEQLVELSLVAPDAFGTLVERYEAPLGRFLRRLFPFLKKEDLSDLLQETFLKAYRHLNDFDPELKFSAWIYRIARNEAVSSFRKKKEQLATQATGDAIELYDGLIEELTAETALDRAQTAHIIKELLTRLTPRHREAFVLHLLEEKSYAEISDILQLPTGTVGTLIHRAKKEFRALASRHGLKFEPRGGTE